MYTDNLRLLHEILHYKPAFVKMLFERAKYKSVCRGDLKIFGVEAVIELFKWAAGTFGFRLAEFFADFYQ